MCLKIISDGFGGLCNIIGKGIFMQFIFSTRILDMPDGFEFSRLSTRAESFRVSLSIYGNRSDKAQSEGVAFTFACTFTCQTRKSSPLITLIKDANSGNAKCIQNPTKREKMEAELKKICRKFATCRGEKRKACSICSYE